MLRSLVLFSVLSLIVACESPRNNRVRMGDSDFLNLAQSMSFSEVPFQIEVKWLVGPKGNINTDNQLLVIVKNQEGKPSSLPEGYLLGFYSTMPSMGHPMDDAGYFEDLGGGIYINKTIGFNMPGDWRHEVWIMDAQFNVLDKVVWDEFF